MERILNFTEAFSCGTYFQNRFLESALREKCLNRELLPVRIFLYSVRTQENADRK